MRHPNKTENIFENELKEEYEKNLSIISCLKDFEIILDKNYTIPIKITIQDKFVVFKLIKNNIEYIEETLLEDKPFESICLKIFKLLFLEEGNLNYDNIKEKANDFQLILKRLKNQNNQDEEQIYIDKVIEMRNEWKQFFKLNYIKYGGLSLLIAVALKYAKTIVEISDFIIYVLHKKHINSFEVKFNLNKLINISEDKIVKNFIKLFKDETEYFYLDFKNDKIEKKLLSPEITLNAINKQEIKKENPSNKRKRKKENKKKKKYQEKDNIIGDNETKKIEEKKEEDNTIKNNESEIVEEEKEEDKSSEDKKSEKEEVKEIQPNENKESEKRKEEQKESKLQKNNNKTELNKKVENSEFMGKEKKEINEESKEITQEKILAKLSILEKEIENQKNMNIRLNNKIENQKNELNKTIESQKKEIESQKKEIGSQKKEIERQKKEIENIKNSSKLESKKMKKKLFTMKGELEKVETDINLIKSRGALKTFIDFFYKGYKLEGEIFYEDKFSKIAEVLNKYNDIQKNDIEIVNKLRILLRESALKLSLGNFEAHNIDKSKPILSQLFKLIDPNDNYDKVEERLKTINADKVMLNSIKSKETYYKKSAKKTLNEIQNKIFNEVTPEKLDSIFIK